MNAEEGGTVDKKMNTAVELRKVKCRVIFIPCVDGGIDFFDNGRQIKYSFLFNVNKPF